MRLAIVYLWIVVGGLLVRPGAKAQGVRIGDAAGPPDASALLDLDVSGMLEKKGILLPRMSESEKLEITSPSIGLLVFQTDVDSGFQYFDGIDWVGFGGGSDDLGNHTATSNIGMSGHWISGDGDNEGIFVSNSGNVGVGIASPTAGLHTAGSVQMNVLAGSGQRMVVADANGLLSTQTIPLPQPTSLSSSTSKSITSASYSGGSSVMDDITLMNMPAGTYLVQYSLVFSGSSAGSFIINANGSNVACTERSESAGNVSGMAVVTLSSTGDIQLRGKKDSGGPGFIVTHRTLTAVQTN